MSSDVYEQICPLSRFIRELENFNHNNQKFSTSEDLTDIVAEKNEELTNIGCSVYRGYTYLTARDEENRRYFCDYLNLWLDEQKNKHKTVIPNVIIEKWGLIENLWNKLNEIANSNRKCERKGNDKNESEIKKRIDLMVYCVNRNYFKGLCKKAISSKRTVNQFCTIFSEFTNKYYTKFYNENKCIDDTLDPDNYRYNIFEDCDLNNITKTFPKFNLHINEFVYDDKSRIQIKKCPSTPGLIDGPSGMDVDRADVDVDRAKVDVDRGDADGGPVILDSDPNEFTQVVHHTLPVQTSFDNKPSKPVYYAGLSALGVVFTSTVLYKYTVLGSVIRSLVSKKEKLRQTTNKHLAEQWLQRTSEYMDSNSENSHYNFPYHSMQN
ncbi:PIR protein [Plasmodium vivax]|uniref:VIR protein n=1 Tax=Plasmodium vivax TaxID=5855 RepID=A0A565A5X1_PLAVI|nr:PIR protein [Plasmodium vivax]